MPFDKARFVKLCGMTTSTHDGEALNALRLANRMLQDARLSWAEVLETVPQAAWRPLRPPPVFSFGKHAGEIVEDVFEDDPSYLVWLTHQPWFPKRYPRHMAEIVRLQRGER